MIIAPADVHMLSICEWQGLIFQAMCPLDGRVYQYSLSI